LLSMMSTIFLFIGYLIMDVMDSDHRTGRFSDNPPVV